MTDFFNKKIKLIKDLFSPLEKKNYSYYPYQWKYLNDPSRFKIWVKSRQIGGSWISSLDFLIDCFVKGVNGIVLTSHADLLDSFRFQFEEHFYALSENYPLLLKNSSVKKNAIELPCLLKDEKLSKKKIIIRFLLSNPRTARGFHGSVLLDEFAFHQDPRALFYSVLPMITRSHLFSFSIISTPNSSADFFYDLVQLSKNKQLPFSLHKTNVYKAIEEGLEIDLKLIQSIMEENEFKRAYLCSFLDSQFRLFNEKILSESQVPQEAIGEGPLYLGIDIGRKNDLSVLVLLENKENTLYLRKIKVMKAMPFHLQIHIMKNWIQNYNVTRCTVDASGIGMPLAESLELSFQDKIIPFYSSQSQKQSLVFNLKWSLLHKKMRLFYHPMLWADFLSISFDSLNSQILSPVSKQYSSHCDAFWALVYAFNAALKDGFSIQNPQLDKNKTSYFKNSLVINKNLIFKDSFLSCFFFLLLF